MVLDVVSDEETAQVPLLEELYQFKEITSDAGSTVLMK